MKFKCNYYEGDVIENILNKYDITKEQLNRPTKKYKKGYNNMDKAVERITKSIENKDNIGVLVDDDCDGFTSGAVMTSYFRKFNLNVIPFFHKGKIHGLSTDVINEINNSKINLLIIPDASSSDTRLNEIENIDVVILDHHLFDVDVTNDRIIRVNNQDPQNIDADTNLTGVGMVYRTLQNLDKKLLTEHSDDDLDLVALGQVGDSSDYSENEIRWIVNNGLKNINNKLLRVILKDRLARKENVTGRDCSFEVIPYINAVARIGSLEEKSKLFDGLCQDKKYDEVHKVMKKRKDRKTGRFHNVEETYNGYELLFEELEKIKKKQNKIVENFLKSSIKKIYSEGGVVIAESDDPSLSSLTGLITAKLTSKFNKPAILVHSNNGKNVYTGSIRGREEVITSLKNWCENTRLFDWVQGHDNASGCQLRADNISKLVDKAKDVRNIEELEVDYLSNNISKKTIKEIYKNRKYFGGKVKYPKIGLTNKVFDKKYINMRGEKTLILQDKKEGVDYIVFNVSEKVKKELLSGFNSKVTVSIFGETGINNWLGRQIPQVIVNRIEVVKNTIKIDDDFDF